MAKPEPPGRLHTSTGTPYEECRTACAERLSRRLYQIALGPFQSRIGRQFRKPVSRSGPKPSISASRLPDIAWASLHFYHIVVTDIARRQAEVCCNPWPL